MLFVPRTSLMTGIRFWQRENCCVSNSRLRSVSHTPQKRSEFKLTIYNLTALPVTKGLILNHS